MGDIVVLIDGSGRFAPAVFQNVNLGLPPGMHIFVRSRGLWLQRTARVGPGAVRIVFRVVGVALATGLDTLWRRAAKRASGSGDDVDFLGLSLLLDVCRAAASVRIRDVEGHAPSRSEASPATPADVAKSSLRTIDDALGQGEADLEFMNYLLGHAKEVHHAFHLIALGDPTGLLSLLMIVFCAMGHTFVVDHDAETLAVDILKERGPKPVRIVMEVFDMTKTSFEVRELLLEDTSLWRELELRGPYLATVRAPVIESPTMEHDIADDFDLSL